MQKLKEQKGITLIALVITIIVMLILVGVTVTVSLNGGLFTTANEATKETQIAQEKEELLMAALGVLNQNGKVDLSKLDSSLPEGFTVSNGIYTSKTGNTFTVTEDGTITLVGGSSEEEPEVELITITFEKGNSSYRFFSLTKDDNYVYCEELDSYEITVPAGSKVEKASWLGANLSSGALSKFPFTHLAYTEELYNYAIVQIALEDIPSAGNLIVATREPTFDTYKDADGNYIDMESFYPTEDITVYCYDD